VTLLNTVQVVEQCNGFIYNPITMAMEIMQQPVLNAGDISIVGMETGLAKDATVTPYAVSSKSGTASSSGNNACVTPASGKKLRVFFVDYNPSAAVTAGFRFGASGDLWHYHAMTTGMVIVAKEFGPQRYREGGINEALNLNLSDAVSTIWNVYYIEV
jgi:hypothetical protein